MSKENLDKPFRLYVDSFTKSKEKSGGGKPIKTGTISEGSTVECKKCQYFYITWQETHPYGCKMFQMKSLLLPSYHVKRESGISCLYFQHKKSPPTHSPQVNKDSPLSQENLREPINKETETFLTANENLRINKLG